METTILQPSELNPLLRRTLESKIDNMMLDHMEIYPGLFQNEAISELQPIIEKLAHNIGDNIYRCNTDMTRGKIPLGAWVDSLVKRRQRGLSSTLDPKLRAQIVKITEFFCKREYKKPDYITLNKGSNSGFPDYNASPKRKVEKFKEGIEIISSGAKLPSQGHFTYRVSPDSVTRGSDNRIAPKARPWAYTSKNADDIKTIYNLDIRSMMQEEKDGWVTGFNVDTALSPFIQNARWRKALAIDSVTNAFPAVLWQTILDPHYVSESIWVLRGATELYTWCNGYYIACTDFNNFDETTLSEAITVIHEVLALHYPMLSRAIEEMDRAYHNLEIHGMDALPIEGSNHVRYVFMKMLCDKYAGVGIQSGHSLTSFYGKIIGTAFNAWAAEEIGCKLNSLEDYENLLKNSGDDNVTRWRDKSQYEKFAAFISEQDQMSCSLEIPAKFLGKEIMLKDSQAYKVCPSPESFVTNSLCPEREAGHLFRKYPTFGLFQRFEEFSKFAPNDHIFVLIKEFYNGLTSLIPNFEKVSHEEEERSKQDKDIQYLLQKYNLSKAEEIYYVLNYRDLPREDLEIFGIVIPYSEVEELYPALMDIPNLK